MNEDKEDIHVIASRTLKFPSQLKLSLLKVGIILTCGSLFHFLTTGILCRSRGLLGQRLLVRHTRVGPSLQTTRLSLLAVGCDLGSCQWDVCSGGVCHFQDRPLSFPLVGALLLNSANENSAPEDCMTCWKDPRPGEAA